MNTSFSLQHISETGNLDLKLISRQYKRNLMAKFMQNKIENPKIEAFSDSRSIKLPK